MDFRHLFGSRQHDFKVSTPFTVFLWSRTLDGFSCICLHFFSINLLQNYFLNRKNKKKKTTTHRNNAFSTSVKQNTVNSWQMAQDSSMLMKKKQGYTCGVLKNSQHPEHPNLLLAGYSLVGYSSDSWLKDGNMRRLHVHKHVTVIQNSLTYTCNSCKYTAKLPTYPFTEPTCCMLFLSFICKVGFRER